MEALIRDALLAIYKAKKTLEKVSITFGQESVYQSSSDVYTWCYHRLHEANENKLTAS